MFCMPILAHSPSCCGPQVILKESRPSKTAEMLQNKRRVNLPKYACAHRRTLGFHPTMKEPFWSRPKDLNNPGSSCTRWPARCFWEAHKEQLEFKRYTASEHGSSTLANSRWQNSPPPEIWLIPFKVIQPWGHRHQKHTNSHVCTQPEADLAISDHESPN